ncbi:MAG: alpha-amylase family glycosyl hydrolase [Planctomycetota bacterium]
MPTSTPKLDRQALRTNDDRFSLEINEHGRFTLTWEGFAVLRDAEILTLVLDGRELAVAYDAAEHDGHTLRVTGRCGDLRVEHVWAVDHRSGQVCLQQDVSLTNTGAAECLVTEVVYTLPALMAEGSGPDQRLQIPGQITPPDWPYAEAAKHALDRSADQPLPSFPRGWLDHCPDQGVGLVTIENPRGCVGAWLWDELRAPAFPTLDGHDGGVDVAHRHQVTDRIAPGQTLKSSGHALLMTTGDLDEHLAAFRGRAYADWEPATRAPWSEDLRVLQISARPIRSWTQRLDTIAAMGFNAVYCVPVWENHDDHWYAIADQYKIDPKVGSEEELKAFVNEAHERGLKVLFDFIPQGTGDRSKLLETHPEWLVRDREGRPFGSHGWGPKPGKPPIGHTYSLDWGRNDVQAFMLDWAMWNVETFDIDGFRTDALHWKEPNLQPEEGTPAWRTFYGGIRLGERLAERLDGDKLLLGELPGPVFGRSHAMTYENAWVLGKLNLTWLVEESAVISAKQWRRWQDLSGKSLPSGLERAYFAATHDLLKVAAMTHKTPIGDALAFAHACSGGGYFVCWAELDWAAIDRGENGRRDVFEQVLRQRARLAGRTCRWDAVTSGNDEHLFVTHWTAPDQPDLFAFANFSSRPLKAQIAGLGDVELGPGESEIRTVGI